jgi:hypothetical protein
MLGTDTFALLTLLPSGPFPRTSGRWRDDETTVNGQQ